MSERLNVKPTAKLSLSLPLTSVRGLTAERRPRFVAFDADRETDGILQKLGDGTIRCKTPEQFGAALALPSTMMVVMTHGYASFPEWVSDHGRGDAKQEAEIAEVAPEQFDCDALVLMICTQHQPDLWLQRLRPGAMLASSPDLVSTVAIASFASALLQVNATSRDQFQAIRNDVGRRC